MSNGRCDDPLTAPDPSALPRDGAFIVEFAAARTGALGGRVEHVVSGLATRFASADELLGFVRDVLGSRTPVEETEP